MPADTNWKIGSLWGRWDPHIHAPGTLKNDQFNNDWTGYLKKIEDADPPPVALGITDYFSMRSYEQVISRKEGTVLSGIPLIFPNIELRLDMETAAGPGINMHLLVSPEDPHHVQLMKENLAKFRFEFGGQDYPCTDEALIRLGRAFKHNATLEVAAAMAEGANQFKISFRSLKDVLRDGWVQKNVLLAITAGKDGLGALQDNDAFKAMRLELGKFSQIIFSPKPSDIAFWRGEHPDFVTDGYTPKPCLHGSDAHKIEEVLTPVQSRYCWIKAEPTFEGLRQVLAEPGKRIHIGPIPPEGPLPGEVIQKIKFENADWMKRKELLLNPGLVTVIGARGSGKTALADLIAFAVDAEDETPGTASFIAKAGELLDGCKTEIIWGNEIPNSKVWPSEFSASRTPRVRYLSQKFVEQLCTPGGALAEPLLEELEAIVFNAIPPEERLECSYFGELRELRVKGIQDQQDAEKENIRSCTRTIAERHKIKNGIPKLQEEVREAARKRADLQGDLAKIPIKGAAEKTTALEIVEKQIMLLQELIAREERKSQVIKDLQGEIQRQIAHNNSVFALTKDRFGTLLNEQEWELFQFKLDSRAISTLQQKDAQVQQFINTLRANGKAGVVEPGLDALHERKKAIAAEIGLDEANAKKRLDIQTRLTAAQAMETSLNAKLADANRSEAIIDRAMEEREEAYKRLFTAVLEEKTTLEGLYKRLKERLAAEPALSKLEFSVQRHIDLDAWVKEGEKLFDLRKEPFRGDGALKQFATEYLLTAWSSGTPQQIVEAVKRFTTDKGQQAIAALANGNTPLNLGLWLFSTGHISIRYGVRYEGVDLQRLSPGARGVVLLTLYLGLDDWDRRPLVVDQPEENLDPQSVFTQLVPFFKSAAIRRQIIMVTHNANLVVNTDSDQVIIASSKRVAPDKLPEIDYVAGGLEDKEIRLAICNILEGGADAFKKRGERYGSMFH